MATSNLQDVVGCNLCPNPVEHHCNLCRVDLCSPCTLKHLADKTNRHEIVEFINRKKGYALPKCNSHKKNQCEMYCKDCCEPTCVMCVTTTHNKHDIGSIGEFIESGKKRIIADLTELENVIVPKYNPKNVSNGVPYEEFDKVLTAIKDQEDKICDVVRDIGRKIRDEVSKQKGNSEQKNKEIKSLAAKIEKELHGIINISESILISSDATTILSYESRNDKFRAGLKDTGLLWPIFLPGLISLEKVLDIFGECKIQKTIVADKQPSMQLNLLETPDVLNTIQSPYGSVRGNRLWNVACERKEKIWICGDDGKVCQVKRSGIVLKTFKAPGDVIDIAFDVLYDILFVVGWASTEIYKIECDRVVALINLSSWLPRGLCHTANGDFLVSMLSTDKRRSRVVRYSGVKEIQMIEHDSQGKSLLSLDDESLLHLTENGNGDICVADSAGGAVVVVDVSGDLRFKYRGKSTKQSRFSLFMPSAIVTDKNHHLIINDDSKDVVHIIDCNGNFIRYIEYSCNGGLSIDTDHNLVVGELSTGKIRVIKYLE